MSYSAALTGSSVNSEAEGEDEVAPKVADVVDEDGAAKGNVADAKAEDEVAPKGNVVVMGFKGAKGRIMHFGSNVGAMKRETAAKNLGDTGAGAMKRETAAKNLGKMGAECEEVPRMSVAGMAGVAGKTFKGSVMHMGSKVEAMKKEAVIKKEALFHDSVNTNYLAVLKGDVAHVAAKGEAVKREVTAAKDVVLGKILRRDDAHRELEEDVVDVSDAGTPREAVLRRVFHRGDGPRQLLWGLLRIRIIRCQGLRNRDFLQLNNVVTMATKLEMDKSDPYVMAFIGKYRLLKVRVVFSVAFIHGHFNKRTKPTTC